MTSSNEMKSTGYYRDQATANSLNNVRMSHYDRARAQQHLEQGMAVADLMLRAMHGAESLFGYAAKLLTGARVQLRV
jgi:hypothetical protein